MIAWLGDEHHARAVQFFSSCAQVMVTGFLGYFAWRIARRQAQTANDKLKLDLYDRRYKVYECLMSLINDAQGRVIPDPEFATHVRNLEQVQFLFGDEVEEWTKNIRKQLRNMNNARRNSEKTREASPGSLPDEDAADAFREYSKLTVNLDREMQTAALIFMPYLDFSKNL
ncbi:MAG: hypothetical protein ACJ8C4_15475 [Gemmataceae bacterium]